MKYVVAAIGDEESIFTFPRDVDHDRMAEAIEAIRFGGPSNWNRKFHKTGEGEMVSAGFVDSEGNCHGRSETLNLDSRPREDTLLLRKAMGAR